MLKLSLIVRHRGHKKWELNDHVYSFLLFVSSRPDYQAEVTYWNPVKNRTTMI